MADTNKCRLCLQILNNGEACFSLLNEEQILYNLRQISPDFIKSSDVTADFIICNLCADKVKSLAVFKDTVTANESKLEENFQSDLPNFLKSICEDDNEICRLCLTAPIANESNKRSCFDFESWMSKCNIHLNKDIHSPSKLCHPCYAKLQSMNDFILQCLERETEVKNENIVDLDNHLSVKFSAAAKKYQNKKSIGEAPSTSQLASPKILNKKQMTKEIKCIESTIDLTLPDVANVTLNVDDQGLVSEKTTTETNVTQELIDVLEGRLSDKKPVDTSTNLSSAVLEETCAIEPSTSKDNIKVNKGKKKALNQKTITDAFDLKTKVVEKSKKPRGRPRQSVIQVEIGKSKCEDEEPPKKKVKRVSNVRSVTKPHEVQKETNATVSVIDNSDLRLENRPVQVTIIKSKKRANKAKLEKVWQELTGKAKEQASTSAITAESSKKPSKKQDAVEITVVKKAAQPNSRTGKSGKPAPKKKKKTLWLYCTLCPFKTYAQNSFLQHQLIHNVIAEVRPLFCDYCRFTTSSEELMNQHKTTHETPNLSYKCVFCDDFFKRKTSCMYHSLHHDDQDVASQFYCLVYNAGADEEYFECYQCDYQNTEESPMPDHVIEHTIEIPKNPLLAIYKCDECPFRTKSEETLGRHKKLHLEESHTGKKKAKKVDKDLQEMPLLKCDKCHYMTHHQRSLINHTGLKHNRAIPPLVAGEELAAKAAKEGKMMFYCNECSYSTYRKENMPRHMLVHRTKENMVMFECPHCIFESVHRRSYTRHMEARHGIII